MKVKITHRAAHAGLCAVHAVLSAILIADGAVPHAACVFLAAMFYFILVVVNAEANGPRGTEGEGR